MKTLEVKNLYVSIDSKTILKGVNLKIDEGDVVALLGPNGHGKSTLFNVIMGHPSYKIEKGEILLDGENVLEMDVSTRSKKGIFLAFQNPVEISGVNTSDFYKSAINSRREKKISLFEYYKVLEKSCDEVKLDFEIMQRSLNSGYSGGERKRNEILQLLLLNPSFAFLDEIDSGLDVDAINTISEIIRKQNKEKNTSFIMISHYSRLFEEIKPSKAYLMVNGEIIESGDYELIDKINKEGYGWIKEKYGISLTKENDNKTSIGLCGVKNQLNGSK